MSATKFTVTDVFATLLQPVAYAIQAETGHTFTRPQWAGVGRRLLASALRTVATVAASLADLAQPEQPEPAPAVVPEPEAAHPAPVQGDEVQPVQEPAPEPTPEPAPAPGVTWEAVRWAVPADLPTEPAPAPVQAEPEPVPAPVAKVSKPSKPRKPKAVKPAPVQVEEPAKVWTVSVISSVHHIPAKTVRNHLASGALRGTKGADGWTVTDADLTAYLTGRTASK